MKILFFPFAGGSSYSYLPFARELKGRIEVLPVELPGRGKRIREPLLKDMESLAGDAFSHYAKELREPWAVFGHSMGALLGYLFVRKAISEGCLPPAHLFISGRGGPSLEKQYRMRHRLPKDQFISELIRIGGLSEEVASSAEILDFAEPILRADFQASETYVHRQEAPLGVPVSVMVGREEETSLENVMYWQRETLYKVEVYPFPGDHFFLFRHVPEISGILAGTLLHKEQPVSLRA